MPDLGYWLSELRDDHRHPVHAAADYALAGIAVATSPVWLPVAAAGVFALAAVQERRRHG